MPKPLLSQTLATLALAGLVLAFAAPAGAGSFYRWETEDGVLAFSDDAKRIPARYKAHARRQQHRTLVGHARFTPTDAAAQARYATQLAARLERLRAFNAPPPAHAAALPVAFAAPAATRSTVSLREGERTRLEFDVDAAEAPIVVDEKRMLDRETGTTRRVTIVRQGDRVLSIVKRWPRWSDANWDTVQDLEEGR